MQFLHDFLYIDCEINGTKISALIDTSFNSTLISARAAKQCGLQLLIDSHIHTTIKGTGLKNKGTVIGVLNCVLIEVELVALPCNIGVIDGLPVDLIMGLDTIVHHRISIDLKR